MMSYRALSTTFLPFARYFSFSLIDRVVAGLTPLVVLLVGNDASVYNQLEYVLALALLASIPLDLGMRSYLMYGYSEADTADREARLRELAASFYTIQLLVALGGAGLALLAVTLGFSVAVFAFVGVRAIFSVLIQFYAVWYRISDNPDGIFRFSILINLSSVLVSVLWVLFGQKLVLEVVLAPYALALIIYFIFSRNLLGAVSQRRLFEIGASAIRYSWPVSLNSLLSLGVISFSKVYVYHEFPEADMTRLSLAYRLGLGMQAVHAAVGGYFHKRLFLGNKHDLFRIGRIYIALLVSALLAAVFVLAGLDFVSLGRYFGMDTVLVLTYVLLWCMAAALETVYNRVNQNILIPLISGAGAITYISILIFLGSSTLLHISTAMVISAFVLLTLSIISLVVLVRQGRILWEERW